MSEVTFTTIAGDKYIGERPSAIEGEDSIVVGTIYFASSGNRYQGELRCRGGGDFTQEGYGCMTAVAASNETLIYDGDWINGRRSGTGRLRRFRRGISTPLTYLYEGSFVDDLPHGTGTETVWTNPLALNTNAKQQQQSNDEHEEEGISASTGAATSSAARLEYVYTGSFEAGLRHGHGLLEDMVKQRIIEGSFAEGLPHGRTVVKWLRADSGLKSYDGMMVRGEMEGQQGTLVSASGEIFRGAFKHNRKLRGVICDADGSNARRATYDEHTGALLEFEDVELGSVGKASSVGDVSRSLAVGDNSSANMMSGEQQQQQNDDDIDVERQFQLGEGDQAKIEYPNGDVFHGDVISGRPHGQGRTVFARGGEYRGGFEHGLFHGQDSLLQQKLPLIPEEDIGVVVPRERAWRYVGNFRDGLFHGRGRWWGALEYEFVDDDPDAGAERKPLDLDAMLEQPATEIDLESEKSRRDFFEGMFVRGAFATGSYTYADGSRYEGEFGSSVPHGRGALHVGGSVIRGVFDQGACCDEHASIEYGGGDEFYEGGIFGNKRHGTGVHKKYKNGNVVECYDGEWELDKKHGVGILENAEVTIEGLFRADVPASHATVRKHEDNSLFTGHCSGVVVSGVLCAASGVEVATVLQ